MKILLVSDIHHFSTVDVYNGYEEALKKIGVEFESVNILDLLNYYNVEKVWGMVTAKMLNVDNGFTHVLFISGLVVPDWLLKSKYDKKIGIIGLDDPHAGKILLDKKQYLDYYFTNEKKMEDQENNIFYLPTATSTMIPNVSKESVPQDYKFNVVFIGTVYDDRVKPLEDVARYCEEKGLTFKIVGPLLKTPKDSIIRKYAADGIISNMQAKLMYVGADLVINIDRNVKWHPMEEQGNSVLFDIGEPYSANPRIYEVSLCKTAQLFINPRPEVKDIYGDNIFYCKYDTVKDGLEQVFNSSTENILKKVESCFQITVGHHTYTNRATEMLHFIRSTDTKEKEKKV